MVSGGGDSVALLDIAQRLGASASALHVNYGLRDGAAADEELVRELCAVAWTCRCTCEHVTLPAEGNLQELARDARYALAEQVAEGDYAAAHTASDQAETVLYRLAVSPGSRALHGMAPRRGRLVRPLLDGDPRGGARLPARARARVARGPLERRPPLRARARAARRARRARASCRPRRAQRSPRPRASCATRPRCWTPPWPTRWRSWRRPGDLARRAPRAPARAPAADPARAGRADRCHGERLAELLSVGRTGNEVGRPRRRASGGGRVRHASLHARRGRRAARARRARRSRPRPLRRLGARGAAGAARVTSPSPISARR